MTRNIKGRTLIYAETPQQCDLCGVIAELRPYGPKGEMICHGCGVKDRKATERRMEYMMTSGDARWGSFERWDETVRALAMQASLNGEKNDS